VSVPALPEEGQEPIPSPILVIGRVRVPDVTAEQQVRPPYIVATRIMRAPGSLALRRAVLYDANGNYPGAVDAYEAFGKAKEYAGHELAPQALYRGAVLARDQLGDRKRAGKLYSDAWLRYVEQSRKSGEVYYVWRESADGVERLTVSEAVGAPMDAVNSDHILYKVMDVFTTMCGGSAGWGVIVLAIITRLLIVPLTQKQLRSTREMQALAPEIKKLQEKYKGDKQTQQKRIMALYKEHGVNPLGGCFPLLIQMPILIALYKGIRMYIYRFSGEEFLWVTSGIKWSGDDLAQPDLLLLVLYTISMIIFQKFTAKSTPATDPQQQQMQQTMTYMMPIMFFFFFQNFPAAFILYWFATNVIFTLHQYWFNLTYQRDKGSPMIALPSWGPGKSEQEDEGAGSAAENRDGEVEEGAEGEGSETATTEPSPERADGAAVSPSKRKRRRRRRPSRRKRRKS
jgi:YidC/Oxa1 family membrane protein insertase